jgi:hypothetical protein
MLVQREILKVRYGKKCTLTVSKKGLKNRGGATGRGMGWGSGTPPPPPTRQQVGKLIAQSAKLVWLKITTEETKIDFVK